MYGEDRHVRSLRLICLARPICAAYDVQALSAIVAHTIHLSLLLEGSTEAKICGNIWPLFWNPDGDEAAPSRYEIEEFILHLLLARQAPEMRSNGTLYG